MIQSRDKTPSEAEQIGCSEPHDDVLVATQPLLARGRSSGSFGEGRGTRTLPCVNWCHRHGCRSGRWRRCLERDVVPWALEGVELGEDVLEVGPGPGLTTDLLRGRTKRLTALELEANAATLLPRRL